MTKPKKSLLKPERELVFDANFLIDLKYWVETDRKIALRLLTALLNQTMNANFARIQKSV